MLVSKVICDDTYIVVLANALHRSKLHPLVTFAALVLLCTATEGMILDRSWIVRLPSLYIGLHARVQGHLRQHLCCYPHQCTPQVQAPPLSHVCRTRSPTTTEGAIPDHSVEVYTVFSYFDIAVRMILLCSSVHLC